MKGASGAFPRAASSRLSVPFALTVKSVSGSRRGPIVGGLGSGMDHQLYRAGVRRKIRSIASTSRMSASS